MSDEEARNLERYREILSKYSDVMCDADLYAGERGRGLFATRTVKEGESVVRVPLERCIFNEINLSKMKLECAMPMSEAEKSRVSWNSEITLTGKLMEVLEQSAFDGTVRSLFNPPHHTYTAMLRLTRVCYACLARVSGQNIGGCCLILTRRKFRPICRVPLSRTS